MKLTVLGSGTMIPTKERHPSAYLLEHESKRLLLDCGHTTVARLVEIGIDLQSIDTVGVTHFHTDHFGDVLPFVHSRFVDDLYAKRAHKPLSLIGPKTLRERFGKLREVMWPEPAEDYPLQFHEFESGQEPLRRDSFSIQQFATRHVPWFPSTGFRVTVNGKSLVYPGDLGTEQDASFDDAIRDADVLLIEAAGIKPTLNHFTVEQAIELAQRCNIRKLLLTHVREARVEEVRKELEKYPNATLATDLLQIDIS